MACDDIRSIDVRRIRKNAAGCWVVIGYKCGRCGRKGHPVRLGCPNCGLETEIVELDPDGVVIMAITVYIAPPDAVLSAPFQVALVQLSGGVVVTLPAPVHSALRAADAVRVNPVLVEFRHHLVMSLEADRIIE